METNGCKWEALTPEILDRMEIVSIIDLYIAGLKFGRINVLKLTIYQDAKIYNVSSENQVSEGSVQELYDNAVKNAPLLNVTSEHQILQQTSNTALVLAKLKNIPPNQISTEHLSMMKIDGDWKIISKVNQLSDANKNQNTSNHEN